MVSGISRPFMSMTGGGRETAGSGRPTPLGLADEPPPPDGIPTSAGSRIPGPLGSAGDVVRSPHDVRRPGVAVEESVDRSVDLPFRVGIYTYRLREAGWIGQPDSREDPVYPPEAVTIIERAALQYPENVPLLRLLEIARSQLSGFHQLGTLVLVRLRPQSAAGPAAKSARAPASPPRAPSLPAAPAVDTPMMPVPVAIAQAAALKEAAVTGVPFCEECAKAAAAA